MIRIALVLGLVVASATALLVLRGSPATEPPPAGAPPAVTGMEPSGTGAAAVPPAAAPRDGDALSPAPDDPEIAAIGVDPDPAGRPIVPLEKLLTLEGAGTPSQGVPGLVDPRPPPWAPRAERRMRLEHSAERAELGSERQIRDEFRFSVPLDDEESLRLRGGVQVDRQQSGGGGQDLGAGPAIGVEKRF